MATEMTNPLYAYADPQAHRDYVRWLEALTYKPGYEFEMAWVPARSGSVLRIRAVVWDSTRGRDAVEIAHNRGIGRDVHDLMAGALTSVVMEKPVPPRMIRSAKEFYDWIRHYVISELEYHERDEWLRVDGELRWDPHAEAR